MKTIINRFFLPGAALITWLLASGCSPQSSSAQTETSTSATNTTNLTVAVSENPPPPPAPVALETAPPSATPAALPSNISPSSPLAQVIRLTQANVDQSIIMTFVTNSSRTFNLDSEKIIYLSDLGAPTELVTAIMQRDQELQEQFAAQQAQQAQAEQSAKTGEPAPVNTNEVAAQPETQPAPVTVNYFYDTLQPYGSWVTVTGYGYCWRPTVCTYNTSWQPYCDRGRWVYTDCGWYWNSDYAWGTTFHYGRWFHDVNLGWCWHPDTVWAPSWVTWRYSNNYCGWAPLPPHTTYQAGAGIVYNGSKVSVGFNFGLGANCYTFVPAQHFCDPHPRNYCVAPAQLTQVYNNTTVINNFNVQNHAVVNHGIAVNTIATATQTPIHPVSVHDINAGIAHFPNPQPDNHFSQTTTGNHRNLSRDFDSPLRMDASAQRHSPRPDHNLVAMAGSPSQFNGLSDQTPPQHDPVNTTVPARSMRADRNNSPSPFPQAQSPASGFQQHSVPQTARPLDTSRIGVPRPNNWQNTAPSMQNRNFQTAANAFTPASQNQTVAAIPQRQPAAPAPWQQTGLPRNYNSSVPPNTGGAAQNQTAQAPVQNYAPPRNNNQSFVVPRQNYQPAPVQSAAPSHAPSQSSSNGGQWANQGQGRSGH